MNKLIAIWPMFVVECFPQLKVTFPTKCKDPLVWYRISVVYQVLYKWTQWGSIKHDKARKKRNPVLRARPTRFSVLAIFFFLICQNLVKAAIFWPKFDFFLKNVENKTRKFSQEVFAKKVRFFLKNPCF